LPKEQLSGAVISVRSNCLLGLPSYHFSEIILVRFSKHFNRRRYLLRKVWKIDPLVCPKCGCEMGVIEVINKPEMIRKILDHLKMWEGLTAEQTMAQPRASPSLKSDPIENDGITSEPFDDGWAETAEGA
jgi:hypothetical protein